MFAEALHNETKKPNASQVARLGCCTVCASHSASIPLSRSLSFLRLNAKAARANEITKCPSAAAEPNKLRHQMSDNQNEDCKDKEKEWEEEKGEGGGGAAGIGGSEVVAR